MDDYDVTGWGKCDNPHIEERQRPDDPHCSRFVPKKEDK